MLVISRYCRIKSSGNININGLSDIEPIVDMDFPAMFKSLFRKHEVKYPKFFKMDNLSKLGMITAELMLKGYSLNEKYSPEEISVILQNSTSTIDVDKEYKETYINERDFFPNPSLFVYTLPNIMIGEICIRHKIQGSSTLFVEKQLNPDLLYFCVSNALEKEISCKAAIAGFVDYSDGNFDSFLLLIEKQENCNKFIGTFTPENIKPLYN